MTTDMKSGVEIIREIWQMPEGPAQDRAIDMYRRQYHDGSYPIPEETGAPELGLHEFMERAWPVVEPGKVFVDNWHIGALTEHLEAVISGEIRNLLVNVPPRSTKSTSVSVVFPAWVWTFHPWLAWLFGSHDRGLSIRDAVASRRLLQSDWYQENWSAKFRLTSDQNVKSRYDNDRGGTRISTHVGGGTGEGGDILVLDDPNSIEDRHSPTKLQSAIEWYRSTWCSRLNDPKKSAKIIVQQRVHEADVSGYILGEVETTPAGGEQQQDDELDDAAGPSVEHEFEDFDVLILPQEYESERARVTSIGFADPREKEGDLLCPERFGPGEIAYAKRVLGSVDYATLHQQRPAPAEGAIILREWWETFPEPPKERAKLCKRIYQSWDMTFKEKSRAKKKGADVDFVCGLVMGLDPPSVYFLDFVLRRMDFVKTCNAVIAMKKRWPETGHILIEDAANGPAVISALKRKVPGIVAMPNPDGVLARVHAVSPDIESGCAHLPLPEYAPWREDFISQWAVYPNAAHDDIVSAGSQGLYKMQEIIRRAVPKLKPLHY